MSEHARLSPSGADRWIACAASVNGSELYPDQSSEAAEEGTRAHNAMEAALRMRLNLGEYFDFVSPGL